MPEQERPNIILIITDQQRYETIKALGYEYMAVSYTHLTLPTKA